MIKKIRPSILLLISFLFLQNSFGQLQGDMTDYLKQKFLRYTEAIPREDILIHSDREDYIAGEDLWFKVYLIDRQSNKPIEADKIVYFELLNPDNLPVIQKRIFIDKGFGPGQILLPDTLSSGTYTIRAYTNWMKNFLPYNCFMKDIRIYNALSKKAFREKIYSDINIVGGKNYNNISVISDAGLTLSVNNNKPDTLDLMVNTNTIYRHDNKNILYLFIQTHGVINHISSENVMTDIRRIGVAKNELIPGINHITILNSKGKPLCERFIYTPEKNKNVLFVNSSGSYKRREKISLDLGFGNELINTLSPANISISVSPVTEKTENIELIDYMVFGSEFGLLPQNVIKAGKINTFSSHNLDTLLLSVKSNWIEWDKILSDNLPALRYQVENEDHYLTGKLLTPDQKAPDTGEYIVLSSPGKVAEFQYARTDYQGNFSFRIPIDASVKDLIIQVDDITKKYNIEIGSSFSDNYLPSVVSLDSSNRPVPEYISKWRINYQVNKIYESSFTGDLLIPAIQTITPKRFYGKPAIELIMADYIKLPVMEEVFFELLPGVALRRKKDIYEISINDPITKVTYGEAPGMLIDGVIVIDPNVIGNLDPEMVEKIDVVREKYFVGNYMFYGIVNLISKAGDYSYVTLPSYAIRMPYRVLDPVWSFVSPDYSTAEAKSTNTPDFRNTLYWNPSVKPDRSGRTKLEFWSSDIVSDYEVKIQGITSEGRMVSLRKTIKVE
ncbi:MAG TPA: hypothetical protein VMV77_08665 [Bacteroidales bacterium]|nr:hypothetical protein [Bacteroidales bacterium]